MAFEFCTVEDEFCLRVICFASGMVSSMSPWVGQMLIVPKRRYMKFIKEIKILLTADWEIPNKMPKVARETFVGDDTESKRILLLV